MVGEKGRGIGKGRGRGERGRGAREEGSHQSKAPILAHSNSPSCQAADLSHSQRW